MKRQHKNQKSSVHPENSSKRFYDKRKLLLEGITLLFVIMMFGIAFYVKPMLPEQIPTHWNAAGQADGFSSSSGVFLIPAIYTITAILLFVLPMMEVFRENILNIYDYYIIFKACFGLFFTVLFITTLLPNFGYEINIAKTTMLMVSLLFVCIGIILPKLKRNFMFGIRTGWTLSSDYVWEKTHKIGGILFAFVGILIIILLFILKLEVLFYIFTALMLLTGIFLVFYSYILFKHELRTKK